jgi:hypothetical protein
MSLLPSVIGTVVLWDLFCGVVLVWEMDHIYLTLVIMHGLGCIPHIQPLFWINT